MIHSLSRRRVSLPAMPENSRCVLWAYCAKLGGSGSPGQLLQQQQTEKSNINFNFGHLFLRQARESRGIAPDEAAGKLSLESI